MWNVGACDDFNDFSRVFQAKKNGVFSLPKFRPGHSHFWSDTTG